jgi:Ca-activated chloride channel homolog
MNRIAVAALLLAVAFGGRAFADNAASTNKKGIEAYRDKRFDDSVSQFTQALVERPNTPELDFNRGTALSGLGKKDEAVNELDTAARGFVSPEKAAAAHYNSGNTLYNGGDYRGALDQYKTAVKLDPQSEDIRYNLELAARKLAEQQKEQNQQDQQKKNDSQNNQQKNASQQKNQQQQQQLEQKKSQQQQQQGEYRPMTKEEAERLLDAMNDEEKKSLALRNQQIQPRTGTGNDW